MVVEIESAAQDCAWVGSCSPVHRYRLFRHGYISHAGFSSGL